MVGATSNALVEDSLKKSMEGHHDAFHSRASKEDCWVFLLIHQFIISRALHRTSTRSEVTETTWKITDHSLVSRLQYVPEAKNKTSRRENRDGHVLYAPTIYHKVLTARSPIELRTGGASYKPGAVGISSNRFSPTTPVPNPHRSAALNCMSRKTHILHQ
jgi:hypothetical protein